MSSKTISGTPPSDEVQRELLLGYVGIPVPYAKLAASLVGEGIPGVSQVRGNGRGRDVSFRSKDGKTRFRAFVAGAPDGSVPKWTVAYFWFVDALRGDYWELAGRYAQEFPTDSAKRETALSEALKETAKLCSEIRNSYAGGR